jgi:hypothetical protein
MSRGDAAASAIHGSLSQIEDKYEIQGWQRYIKSSVSTLWRYPSFQIENFCGKAFRGPIVCDSHSYRQLLYVFVKKSQIPSISVESVATGVLHQVPVVQNGLQLFMITWIRILAASPLFGSQGTATFTEELCVLCTCNVKIASIRQVIHDRENTRVNERLSKLNHPH